eukprot:Opistho-2@20691
MFRLARHISLAGRGTIAPSLVFTQLPGASCRCLYSTIPPVNLNTRPRPAKTGEATPDLTTSQLQQLQETLSRTTTRSLGQAAPAQATIVTPSKSASTGIDRLLSLDPSSESLDDVPVAHVTATNNNTHVTISDSKGRVVAAGNCGLAGFKNAKKGTAYAAQQAAFLTSKKAYQKFGVREVRLKVSGVGQGRYSCVRGIQSAGIRIVSVTDVTPIPHNGCRPKKTRRL